MTSSFNAFGASHKEWGNPSVPVWLGKVRAVPVGGSFADAYIVKGAFYAAGTPILLDGKTIKPLVAFEVVNYVAGESSADSVITIKPAVLGDATLLPSVGDNIAKVGATFAAAVKGAAVKSIAPNATDATTYDVAIAHAAIDAPSAGDYIAFATGAGSSKALAVIPNAYLYNDVYLGDIDVTNEMAGASGAAIQFHAEGILINRTPSAPFKAQMAAAVPGVLQVNY